MDFPGDPDRWDWITRSFQNQPELGEIQRVAEHRLQGQAARPFQIQIADSKTPVVLVKAACGTGKTVAAYLWAAKNYPTRRLYFCYPTTGTATEGFRDYLWEPDGELGDIGAKLFHSRKDVDWQLILNNGNDLPSTEILDREYLERWSTPIAACTVDTVLGCMQNHRKGLLAFPALCQSAFVFDEIHAYDDKLFGLLLRFLREMPGVPALLMTASLPTARETALRELLQKTRGIDLVTIEGPPEIENSPRYHRGSMEDLERAVKQGGKVLWVSNTVQRAMGVWDARGGLLYHSRYKYEDRVRRHKDVIDAFSCPGPALAVCTQVAEMSLDLSADVLVTDLAPVPSLIQRMGRLNRRAKPGDPTRPFVIIEPDKPAPYAVRALEQARQWIQELGSGGLSQRDLVERWHQDAQLILPGESTWCDGGPATTVASVREQTITVTVLQEEDSPLEPIRITPFCGK